MIKTRKVTIEREPTRRLTDVLGLCLFFLGAACLLSLTWLQDAPGPMYAREGLLMLAGLGAYLLPVIMMFIGSMFLIGFEKLTFTHSTYGSLLLFVTFVTWRHLSIVDTQQGKVWSGPAVQQAGGYLGAIFGTVFHGILGAPVSYLLLTLMTCISVVLLVDRPFIEALRWLRRPADAGVEAARKTINARIEKNNGLTAEKLPAAQGLKGLPKETEKKPRTGLGALLPGLMKGKNPPDDGTQLPLPFDNHAEEIVEKAIRNRHKKDGNTGAASDPDLSAKTGEIVETGVFQLPPTNLLHESPPAPKRTQQELTDKIKVLEQTLDQFGIGANVVEIAHGPTVTRYEIELAPGIKVSKIVSLADNLAMALAAIDVRVEAPIPGKSAIGIEVPNANPTIVSLRECLETPEFRNSNGKLLFALGKDVAGDFKYADLTRMPHLLIGGSTNSGKSVALNTLIASMLYRLSPSELKFLMIDPKRVELSLWDGIPHLSHPVVKDVKQAAGIFRSAIKEMERRYDMFAKVRTRNIEGYNAQAEPGDKLYYLVIVVDELADLMMQEAAEIETSICRLAQLARATGIHLVIATQRPSVDVITGLIKANISSRMAFAVSSQVDSRTILDHSGAERLIGRGDMLYMPIDAMKPTRIQGCYLSEEETKELVNYLKEQQEPNYTITPEEISGGGGSAANAGGAEDDDELYESAVRLVVSTGQASTSMLQRRFKIGFARAGRLMDLMQDRGIVGASDRARPRDILVSKDEIDRLFLDGYGE